MLKLLTTAAFVAGSLATGLVIAGQAANAQDKLVIAISPKALNNPFFDQAKLGCEKAVWKSALTRWNACGSARASMAGDATSRCRSSLT